MTDEARMARIKNAIEAFARQNNIHMQALEPEGGGWASDVAFLLRMLASRDVDIAECARALRQEKDEVERLIKRDAEIERLRSLLPCGHLAANVGDTGACEACQDIAAVRVGAVRTGRRQMREEAARLVDKHPDAEDAGDGCEDARGCCEVMTAQVRALPDDPPQPREQSDTDLDWAVALWSEITRDFLLSYSMRLPIRELCWHIVYRAKRRFHSTAHAAAARQAALEEAARWHNEEAGTCDQRGYSEQAEHHRDYATYFRALAAQPEPKE